ncbi:MAG: amidohydrolase family protein [Alphaproteobacteria bacterium]|nr:amidohydrolase family protein [Alphaproteobacteria bacterium]MBU1527001.1 amidohydrolase family protein [Alphaproteobacteria bacterium]MBU2116478.1 amidohydrolase family protein [Alphaproteobacteria bacterium]MBU2351980.1 amidohydrolase family protein [Alphaproteobacteria bacterium]MBU2382192.1 amidohydrolase family protein [Alphaproteobacteria bacterium]
MTRRTLTACAALLAACLAAPAEAQMRRPQGPTQLVRAGDLFDSQAGRMVGARDILIRGDRVVEVGQGLALPDGGILIDLSRCSVLPGLIDGHTHILMEQAPGQSLGQVAAIDAGLEGDALRALSGARRGRDYLDAGFTTIRDLGNSGRYLDLQLARGFAEGRVPGPRLYGSGPGLAPAGGQMEPLPHDPHHLVGAEYRIVAGADDARAAVREAVAAGAWVIKVYPEATPQRTRLSVAELEAIVDEARRHGVPVAAHATSDAAIREAVMAGVTSIEHGYEVSDETLRLMAQKGVWLVPTDPSLEMAQEFSSGWTPRPPVAEIEGMLAAPRERFARAHRLGVPIALGSDLYIPYGPGRGQGARATMVAYVESGMTPAEALQTATWNAGRMLGDDGLGVIRPGAWADLIAVPLNPTESLDALKDVRFVMKGGRVEKPDREWVCGG